MAICSHSPGKARGKCPPHNVAQEFAHKPKAGYRKRKPNATATPATNIPANSIDTPKPTC